MSAASAPAADAESAARPETIDAHPPGATRSDAWKNVAGYTAAACLSLAVAAVVLQLWRADLTMPLFDDGDGLMAQMFVRNVLENGWFLDNGRLGAPGALDLRDFPMADALHFGTIKLLGCVFHDPAVVFNLFALTSFPLTALSGYFVFRRLRLGRLGALVPAVLYASTTYHFWRVQCHLFLAAYYLLPPMLLLALRVYLGRSPLLRPDPDGRPRWRLLTWEAAGAALLCVLTGLAGVYYAFFTCFFLLAAGLKASFRERRWAPAAASVVLVLIVTAAVAGALAPTFVNLALHGRNPAIASRLPAEADVYGLSVTEMLLPIQNHRIGILARAQKQFMEWPRRPTGEAYYEPLGVLGSLGFLYLVGRFLLRRRDRQERAEDGLAFFTVAAVLLGTVGGFGSCFAFCVTPMIRCYNRISICVAFFALAGLFLLGRRLTERYARSSLIRVALAAGLVGLLVLGALDQTTPAMAPHYAETRKQFASDEDFGRRVEAALPADSMVYQMPYVPFPEYPPVEQLREYELLRPFLHTHTLRWSYGAMNGRETAHWEADLAQRPLPEAVERLAWAGFQGVYLDRAGYADQGAATETELTRLLGVEPMVSLTGRQTFFDMTSYVRTLRAGFTDDEWKEKQDAALHPVKLEWGGSFSGSEANAAEGQWRWCGAEGQLHIVNPARRSRKIVLKMECSGLWDQTVPSRLVVDGDQCHRELSLTAARQPLELELDVPPGDHVLRFSCDGRRLSSSAERREIVFRVWNFESRVGEE